MKRVLQTVFGIALAANVFGQGDPVALYLFNGDASDSSPGEYDGVVNGATLVKDRFDVDNSAYSFDGDNDDIDMGDVHDMGASDFMVEVWVKVSEFEGLIPGTGSTGASIVNKGHTLFGTPQRAGYGLSARKENGENYFRFSIGGQYNKVNAIQGSGFVVDQWYLLQGIRKGDKIFLYVDGELIAEASIESDLNVDTNIPFVIGSENKLGFDPNGTTHFHGVIDDVRLYDQVGLCDATSNYSFNGNSNDQGSNSNDGVVNGATLITDRNGVVDGAYSFDGQNDDINFGDVLDVAEDDFSVSSWVKVDDFKAEIPGTGSAGASIVSKGGTLFGTPSRAGYVIRSQRISEVNYFRALFGDENSDMVVLESGGYQAGAWYFVTITRIGDVVNLFVNGELKDSGTLSTGANLDTNIPFVVGSEDKLGNDPNGTTHFDGIIDEVQVYDCGLSNVAVWCLYNDTKPDVVSTVFDLGKVDDSNWVVFPNPTSDHLEVLHTDKTVKSVNVSTLSGVHLEKFTSSKIDVSSLPQGFYLLEIENFNGEFSQIKFVKK